MDKPEHPGSGTPRSHQVDEDFFLIKCLRNKVQDPDSFQFHAGNLIPTFDIFSVYPPESFLQGNADEQKVWYFFSPKLSLVPWEWSPSDQSVADGCWRESSPLEIIFDEFAERIAEKRILRHRNWTMHELRLFDSPPPETSSNAGQAVKNNPSDSMEVDKPTPFSPFFVLCKIFKEAANAGINEEANTETRGQVGQPTTSPNIPPDDRSGSKDPAEDDDEQAETETETETESSSNGSSARAEPSDSTITTAASHPPGYNPGSTTEDSSTSS